jgi:hypothetical protein
VRTLMCDHELLENTMSTSTHFNEQPSIRLESPNWVANDTLPRDQTQSHLLHQPDHLINTIDPMTGNDIKDVLHHPSVIEGNLTIYFETEATRKAYLAMPMNHPNRHLPYPAKPDDDRGG